MKKSVPARLKPNIKDKPAVQNMIKYSVNESKIPVQSMIYQRKHTASKDLYHHQFYKFRTAHNLNQGCQSNQHSYNNQDASAFRSRLNESQVRENVLILRERLRNIQDHYQKLIQEEKAKDVQKSEIVMGLIDEMQMLHKKKIQESAQQNQEVGEVDQKMNDIKNNIEQLIQESNNLKLKNEKLEAKIQAKIKINQQKQQDLEQINKELLESRNEVEQFEIINLKNNKINKEIAQLFKLTYD